MNSDTIMRKRGAELSKQCIVYEKSLFTKFLSPYEQQLIMSKEGKCEGVVRSVWGGYEDAERKMVAFSPVNMETALSWPFCAVQITASLPEALTHRDYLGALMGLGIKRETIGDVWVTKSGAELFCTNEMAAFLVSQIEKVGCCSVTATRCEDGFVPGAKKEFKCLCITVASNRLDGILAGVLNQSRSSAAEIIQNGKVMVNFVPCENGVKPLKVGDVISVRGFGKMIFDGEVGQSKKGRLKMNIKVYQ